MNLKNHVIIFLISITIIVLVNIFDNGIYTIIGSNIFACIFGCATQKFYNDLTGEYSNIRLFFQTLRHYNKHVRVSVAYLYRIKIDNTYLLIKGKKVNKYQPVGGVYKYYDSSISTLRQIFVDDDEMKYTNNEKSDLRGKILGKNLFKFVNWFNSGIGREYSAEREFYEELISSNILSEKKFSKIKYEKVRVDTTAIRTDGFYGIEYLIADIFELIPTNEQENELRKLKTDFDSYSNKESLGYVFANSEEIKQERIILEKNNLNANITNHSKKIL